ncbi:hypothetical protein OG389_34380 [Streptomyces sp. NBC_00435]|uniref:hypothetical protein n=1 Tax=Streptomyces sp. NBC_00435 TaxID=2903649 RepID=UPI002E1F8669
MAKSDEIPAGQNGPDEDEWNAFVLAHAASGPSAAPVRPKRTWPRTTVTVLFVAGLAFVALKFTGSPFDSGITPPAGTEAVASPASATQRPVISLGEAFPAHVPDGSGGDFTRVAAAALKSCTEPGSVGPGLAAGIRESGGCVGEQVALYKDAHGNQYNLAVFTMKDPGDAVHLVTGLSMAMDDYQVAAQAPPAGSGLPVLPADSGMVQAFTSQGRAMVVGLGQWSDGRAADYQNLVDRLSPLLNGVSDKVARYENPS